MRNDFQACRPLGPVPGSLKSTNVGARTSRLVSRRSTRPTMGRRPPPTTNSKSCATLSTRTRTGISITRSFSTLSVPRASLGLPVPPHLKAPPSSVKRRQNLSQHCREPRTGRCLMLRDSLRTSTGTGVLGHAHLHGVRPAGEKGGNRARVCGQGWHGKMKSGILR